MNLDNNFRNEFGVQPVMYTGLGTGNHPTPWTSSEAVRLACNKTNKVDTVDFPHPVAEALAKRGAGVHDADRMRLLAATDGWHAPLRLAMEDHIMRRIEPRLPGLHSYHPLAAQLNGTLDDIDVTDFLNPPEDAETVGMPHLLMERRLGIL